MNFRSHISRAALFLSFAFLFSIIGLFLIQFGELGSVLAGPLLQPDPAVSLSAPSQVMIGEDFSFTVSFDNSGDQTGYGPFIDVVFPVNGADGDPADPGVDKDGISFLE